MRALQPHMMKAGLAMGLGMARVQGGRTDWIFTSGGLDGRITFTRASSGTYFDSAGVMQTATTDVPRFNYGYNGSSWSLAGLLIEPAATNLITYSEQFDNAAWTKASASITANAIAAPDGATTADKLVEVAATASHNVYRSLGTLTGTYTYSTYVKAAERSWVYMEPTGSSITRTYYNLSGSGSVGTLGTGVSASIQYVGNGWYRIIWTYTFAAATGWGTIGLSTGDGVNSYAGDGSSGLYLAEAQFEAGSAATSYIVTTAATATRAADVASITGSNFSSWFNPVEGTWVAEWTSVSSSSVVAQISDATNSNRFQILHDNGGQTAITTGGVGQGGIDAGTVSTTATNKIAYAYKVNDTAASLNGGAVVTDTTVTLPVVDRITLGATVAPANHLNGHLARLTYYPQRLSNAQLVTLST